MILRINDNKKYCTLHFTVNNAKLLCIVIILVLYGQPKTIAALFCATCCLYNLFLVVFDRTTEA